jgi:hypothetical protein
MGLKAFQNLTSDFPASWLDDNFTYLEDLINNFSIPAAADTSVTFTDITTNNASVSKHGFMPKLDGSALKMLLGDGSWGTRAFKLGTANITANGTKAITGVGFQPSAVIILAQGQYCFSVGIDDGTNAYCIYGSNVGAADRGLNISSSASKSVYCLDPTVQTVTAYISALGSDGFTLTVAGYVSVTTTIYYLALP